VKNVIDVIILKDRLKVICDKIIMSELLLVEEENKKAFFKMTHHFEKEIKALEFKESILKRLLRMKMRKLPWIVRKFI
jgi:hypothetical protein